MTTTLQSFKPTPDKIFVTDLERGMSRTAGGIILADDVGKDKGIRPRWGRVALVGTNITDVTPGDWVFIEHGRWSVGIDMLDETTGKTVRLWHIDDKAMLMVSETDPRPASYKGE
jgi:co-chaperonin GroES (HSP10)